MNGNELSVIVEPKSVTVTPGGNPVTIDVHVFNVSPIVDAYDVGVPQAPPWLHVTPGVVRLLPNTNEVVQITVSIPPNTLVPAQQAGIDLEVSSRTHPSVRYLENVSMTVPTIAAPISVLLEPDVLRLRDTSTGTLRLTLDNRSGNDRVRLSLTGRDDEGVVRFTFTPSEGVIPPGELGFAQVRVDAPRPEGGKEVTRHLTVTADADGRTVKATATLIQNSSDRRPIARLMLTLLGGMAMIVGAFLRWTASSDLLGIEWTYLVYGEVIDVTFLPLSEEAQRVIPTIFLSAGIIAIILGLLTMVGVTGKSGSLTRAGAVLLFLFVVVFLVVLGLAAGVGSPGAGAILIFVGCIAAFVGSLLTRR